MIILSFPTSTVPFSTLFLCTPLLFLVPRPYIHFPSLAPLRESEAGIRKNGNCLSCQRLLRFRSYQGSLIAACWGPASWAPTPKPRCRLEEHRRGNKAWWRGVEQHSRCEGVQAAGFHLQQAVPPVCPGYTEIVHGAPKDPKGGVLQHKVLAFGVQPRLPVS